MFFYTSKEINNTYAVGGMMSVGENYFGCCGVVFTNSVISPEKLDVMPIHKNNVMGDVLVATNIYSFHYKYHQ